MGEKKADNYLRGIVTAKNRGLAKVLTGLTIRHLGSSMAQARPNTLATSRRCSPLPSGIAKVTPLISALVPDKGNNTIEGLGRKTADSIFHALATENMQIIFQELADAGVDLTQSTITSEAVVQAIAGKTFVLTGTLPPTHAVTRLAQPNHRRWQQSDGVVSRKTDFWSPAKPGGKLSKAEKLGVAVLSEQDLLELLSDKHLRCLKK